MKSILMSIKPRFAQLILGKDKTIEIRKRFPSDYVGWVYIYCTKGDKDNCLEYADNPNPNEEGKRFITSGWPYANGKVVARFWCDKVGVIKLNYCFTVPTIAYTTFADKYYSDSDLQIASCLNGNELMKYLGTDKEEVGYAIPISNLEIFDEPKELSEFKTLKSINQYKKDIEESRKEDLEIHERIIRDIENCGETTWAANNEECTEYAYNLGCYGLQRPPQSWQYIEVEE